MKLAVTLLIQIPLLPGAAAIGVLTLAAINVRRSGRSNQLNDLPRRRVQGITHRLLRVGADNPGRDRIP
jgi:hypothetical protein